jgi:capsular polysaccharide biosynthesis protein
MFMVSVNHAMVTDLGMVRTAREDLILEHSCFSRFLVPDRATWTCDKEVKSIFVVSAMWGNETGHFLGETLPRIVPFLPLPRDSSIHMVSKPTPFVSMWLRYLNITNVVWGATCAESVLIPQESDCRGGSYAADLLLKTRDSFELEFDPKRVVILDRGGCSRREVICDSQLLVTTLKKAGYSDIHVLGSSNKTFWACIPCQMDMFRQTRLFIGSHGAGLMNIMFMPPESFVVEIASWDRPELNVLSNFAQRAYVYGLHYFHYYWHSDKDKRGLDVDAFVQELFDFAPPVM